MNAAYGSGCETVIYDGQEVWPQADLDERRINAHSTAKLIQVLPIFLLGIDSKYSLSNQELAIMSASHLGQDVHIRVLKSLMEKMDLYEDQMCIPEAAPSGKLAHRYWLQRRGRPSKLYHQCAGNHLALMAIQRELTGSVAGYTDFHSKVQNLITGIAQEIYRVSEPPELTRDFCGAPSYMVSLSHIAVAYKNLSAPSAYLPDAIQKAVQKNFTTLKENPLLLEGDGCLSTILTSGKDIVAKTGAEGLLAIGIRRMHCGIAIQSYHKDFVSVAQTVKHVLAFLGYTDEILETQLTAIASQ